MFSDFISIYKAIVFLFVFLLFGTVSAHEGRTPFSVLKGMKQNKSGPYASPMMMGNNTLIKDWLGVQAKDVSGADSQPGVLIVEVREGGVADEEGLESGDIIIGVGSTLIQSQADLENFLAGIKEPDVFTFRLIRDSDEEDEDVYLNNSFDEMDEEMTSLILSKNKKGGFEKGMLMEDMMARSPLGSMNGQKGVISPQAIMQQMLSKTPMAKRGAYPANMKNVDLKQPIPASVGNTRSKTALGAPHGYKKNRIVSNPFFQKAAYQTAIDRKVKTIQHSESLKDLTLSQDQKQEMKKMNRIIKKYLIKQNALLAIARLDLEGALEDSATDQVTNESLVRKYRQLQEEKYIRLVRFIVEFENLLKPE